MIAFNVAMVSAIQQYEKKYGTLHEFLCHPHTETMLIFSL